MKILLLLLACIAATNAYYVRSYYYRYGYRYPTRSYYTYNVYFVSSWCTASYYSPILKLYPGEDCKTEGWVEKDVADVKLEMENLLKEKLLEITTQITNKRDAAVTYLESVHTQFKASQSSRMTTYYQYQIDRATTEAEKVELRLKRDEEIKQYADKLDASKTRFESNYNLRIESKLNLVKAFHAQLVAKAEQCLISRKANIEKFKLQLDAFLKAYVDRYTGVHTARVATKVAYYKAMLIRVHGDEEWKKAETQALVDAYQAAELAKSEGTDGYLKKIEEFKEKLIQRYCCASRCGLCNGCYYYYKKFYTSYSYSLGRWWTYRPVTRYSTYSTYCYFNFRETALPKWRKTEYSGLVTCDVDTVNPPEADAGTEFTKACEKAAADARAKFATWKAKWLSHCSSIETYYKSLVNTRLTWLCNYYRAVYQTRNNSLTLTPAQEAYIALLKSQNTGKCTTACSAYKASLEASMATAEATFEANIAAYKAKLATYLDGFVAKYKTCLETRTTKIDAYKTELESGQTALKATLTTQLAAYVTNNKAAYEKMLKYFHGDELPAEAQAMLTCYETLLQGKSTEVSTDFDTNYADLIPKLVMHMACTEKCISQAATSFPSYTFGYYYYWRYTYPTYTRYTYLLGFYRRYRYFRVTYRYSSRRYVLVY